MERVHELPACKPLIGGALASPVAPAKMAANERRSTRIRKSRICLSTKSADLRSFAFIRGQSAARRCGSVRRVVGRGRSRDETVSRGTLTPALSPPRRIFDQGEREPKGSQRHAHKVPMRGPSALVFPRVFGAHGHTEIAPRACRRPAGPRAPGKTRKVLVNRQQRFQLPFDGSLSLLAGDGAFTGQFTRFLRHNPQFRNRPSANNLAALTFRTNNVDKHRQRCMFELLIPCRPHSAIRLSPIATAP